MKRSSTMQRLGYAFVTALIILFVGYMCGAPIVYPDSGNFPAYFVAVIWGGVAFLSPWELDR